MSQSCEGRGYTPKNEGLQFCTLPWAVVTDKYPQHSILQASYSDESCHGSMMPCKLYTQGLFPAHRLYHSRSRSSSSHEGWIRGISLGPEFCHMSWCWSQSLGTSKEEPTLPFTAHIPCHHLTPTLRAQRCHRRPRSPLLFPARFILLWQMFSTADPLNAVC